MRVVLSQEDVLEVEFESAEQVFEITQDKARIITITQTAGYEMNMGDEDEECRMIYEEESA